MLAEAASGIGDAQVRNLGTIGGSLSHADPAADWPAATCALEASVRIAGPRGERNVPVEQFISGPLTTTLEPNELVIQIRVPLPGARSGSAYEKLPHPASRFAIVGAAAALTLDGRGTVQRVRVALTGLSPKVARAFRVEKALEGTVPSPASLDAAAEKAAEGLELRADAIGSADYNAPLAAVFTRRALRRAVARAGASSPLRRRAAPRPRRFHAGRDRRLSPETATASYRRNGSRSCARYVPAMRTPDTP